MGLLEQHPTAPHAGCRPLRPQHRGAQMVLALFAITSCHNTRIDTMQRWCEHLSGVSMTDKYAPFWAVLPSVSFEYVDIRESYTHVVDSLMSTIVGGRAPRMAWQDSLTLHVNSISDLMQVSRDSVLEWWRTGLERGSSGRTTGAADECYFRTAVALFDTVKVHFHELQRGDPPDTTVAIPTRRKLRL